MKTKTYLIKVKDSSLITAATIQRILELHLPIINIIPYDHREKDTNIHVEI